MTRICRLKTCVSGADYTPRRPHTHFAYPDDGGSLERASLRCVGLGECRKHDTARCVPSYMVTLEEQHSTRGRAHMLFELLQGEVVRDGWQDEDVKKTLDLCLSCKACKSECPTNVDMATYRAEFLSHYYDGRRRPIQAYAFGMIDRWLRIGAMAPTVANALAETPGVTTAIKRFLHVSPERRLPRLAAVTFRQWAAQQGIRTVGRAGGDRRPTDVILWVDTFNNSFHPETSRAALEVLQSAGFSVTIPRSALCCGRPLYDFGLLDRAKKYLRTILQELGEAIDAGVPMVVLEPSCASVFRDELRNLFPNDARAMRLRSQTFLLSELLESERRVLSAASTRKRALIHGHCHQKALMKMGHDESLLRKIGADGGGSRFRLLRHGRRVWFRSREIRDLTGDRRAGAAAGGPKGIRRDADRGGWVQLSRADRTGDGPAAPAPGGGAEDWRTKVRIRNRGVRIQNSIFWF